MKKLRVFKKFWFDEETMRRSRNYASSKKLDSMITLRVFKKFWFYEETTCRSRNFASSKKLDSMMTLRAFQETSHLLRNFDSMEKLRVF